MIINIIYVHDESCNSQMDMKLLSLNEESENFEYANRRHNMFQGPKKRGGATIRGTAVFTCAKIDAECEIVKDYGHSIEFLNMH